VGRAIGDRSVTCASGDASSGRPVGIRIAMSLLLWILIIIGVLAVIGFFVRSA
jgi:hypothetical protein